MLSKAKFRFLSGKKSYFHFYAVFIILIPLSGAFSQSTIYNPTGGTWTWISGDSASNSPGVFGTQGVPSEYNHPPGLYEASEWKDKMGNFWIYGGSNPDNSDLWKYNPSNNEWTWIKGSGLPNQPAVFGIQGSPNPANTPGMRPFGTATWVDTSGNLWLLGGINDIQGFPNDLWKYDISTNIWTWMKGDTTSSLCVHGTLGVPSPLNNAGGRCEIASSWTDSLNNLWLYGGDYLAAYDDVMKYDISTNEWTWMKGSTSFNVAPKYGVKGVTNATNDPGGRFTYTKWKDLSGNFWIMGGVHGSSLNDTWKYDLGINEWTWMSGSDIIEDSGRYIINCVFDSINLPRARCEQRSSVTDNCHRFWLFGGSYENRNAYNDLWVFDPQQLNWNWVSGANTSNQSGNYGIRQVPSSGNMPPSRLGAVAWWGNDNKFYLFGGYNSQSATYSDLWVFNPDTNCIPVCGQAVLYPSSNFQSSNTVPCAYDCINFTNLSVNAVSWQWSFPGAIDSSSTAITPQNICYTKPGIYNVTLIASNAAGRDSVTFSNYINVIPSPPIPVIAQHNDTLYCSTDSSYHSYQWYLDSTSIDGATDTFLVVTTGGNYNVKVTNGNGCITGSGINIVLGIQNYSNNNILYLYPNPAGNELKIMNGELKIKAIVIYNVLGQPVSQPSINDKQSTINVFSLVPGIYFVQVATESGRWVGRFVKE